MSLDIELQHPTEEVGEGVIGHLLQVAKFLVVLHLVGTASMCLPTMNTGKSFDDEYQEFPALLGNPSKATEN